MDPGRSSGDRSGNSGEYGHEIAESLRFQEEIQSLMTENESGAENGSSFTALLGLPPNQAMELLHDSEIGDSPAVSPPGGCPIWRLLVDDPNGLAGFPLGTVPTFPSNTDLVERAARLSVFAAEDSPQTSSSKVVKTEPAVSDSNPDSSPAREPQLRPPKRKEPEKSKAKGSAKRSKSSLEKSVPKPTEEKLPYVHVRARRGQATDSHSLAERARREKINARMKLLQELVPGCSKISGTALVLDEIINHVQSLQRQVEFLSMRLAAVNPRIDFSGLDSFLSAEGRAPVASGVGGGAGPEQSSSPWDDTRRQQHQIWQVDFPPAPPLWWRGDAEQHHELAEPRRSLLRYDSVNSVCLRSNQLKQEL